jgi:FlaA1/EpsC-like NDP-sugar epimerase
MSGSAQLVLHAAALPSDPQMCVLDRGEPIRIAALARDVIRLAGYDPDGEMPMTFIGLRPGEKLFKQLVGPDERTERAPIQHLLTVERRRSGVGETRAAIAALQQAAAGGDDAEVVRGLRGCIPSFAPSAIWRIPRESEELAG